MTPFGAIALYPLWSFALALGLVALRLGQRTGRGLVALTVLLALWVTGILLLETTAWSGLAERVLPLGMLLGGAFVHAGADVAGLRARRGIALTYAYGVVIGAVGATAPRLFYGPEVRGAKVLFVPVGIVSTLATVACVAWLARLAWRAARGERARRIALATACAAGGLGGGGILTLRVLGLGDVAAAAPLLLVAVGLVGYVVVSGEAGRAREVVTQGAVYAVATAAFSAVGLVVFFRLLPVLSPGGAQSTAWLVFVVFFAALPLDPLRILVVEAIGRALFRRPINVRELEGEVQSSEARAEHAERLAEMGRVVSAVAHEMRNPLGVIAAQAKLAEPGAPEAALAIRGQVDRARRFLDDLLRYGRPRPLEIRAVEPAAAVQLAVLNVTQAWKGEPPVIAIAELGVAGTVEADRAALVDALTALVHNAAVAAASTNEARVRVATREENGDVLFVVEDEGPGVPPELRETLFQPFVTGRGRDAEHPGTGLGLAIAARWAERHGGAIRHERPEAGGARFVLRWPRSGR